MSRLTDAMITGAYAQDVGRPMANLELGGQHGWAPNLLEWHNNKAHVSTPMHCILLEAPRMFKAFPNSQNWIAAIKAMFETHAYAIEGLNAELKVDTDTHDVGGAGEKQHEVVNVTRETSTPKFTFIEKYGRPIQTLLDYWIRYGLGDPDSKFALLGTMNNTEVKDMLADWYSATCLFIVPDPLHRSVDKAWLTTNMFPTSTGAIVGKRDLKTGQEILTLDIEFPGLSQTGLGVSRFAQTILDKVRTTRADPFMRPAFATAVSADVEAASRHGYQAGIEKLGAEAVTHLGS